MRLFVLTALLNTELAWTTGYSKSLILKLRFIYANQIKVDDTNFQVRKFKFGIETQTLCLWLSLIGVSLSPCNCC